MEISNSHVLITGANRGIGLGIARRIAMENCHIHILMRFSNEDLKKELLQLGALSVTEWIYDLGKEHDLSDCVERIKTSSIDLLINNAGLLTGGLVEEQSYGSIQQMFQVNVLSLIRLTQAVIPGMIQRKKGKIVNNSSVSAIMHFPGASTYAAGKAAVFAFTNCLRQELKPTEVTTLTLITPGVKTKMFDEIEVMYSKNLETPKDTISIDEYADQVIKAIQTDKEYLWPKGNTFWGLFISKYVPLLFDKVVQSKFKR